MKMVFDGGHGGRDPGAVGPSGLLEKDVALEITLKAGSIVSKHGVEVFFTRENDKYVSLDDRIKFANDLNADYFLSIHINSATNPLATGTETYAYKTGTTGDKFAHSIQNSLVKEIGLTDRKVKYSQLRVTRETKMPAALTEVAFINNPKEEALLKNKDFINKAAAGIAKGVLSHLGITYVSDDKKLEGVSTWAVDAMKWAMSDEVDLTDGTNPGAPISLERFITILYRYHKLQK